MLVCYLEFGVGIHDPNPSSVAPWPHGADADVVMTPVRSHVPSADCWQRSSGGRRASSGSGRTRPTSRTRWTSYWLRPPSTQQEVSQSTTGAMATLASSKCPHDVQQGAFNT
jgi:hypothetical protein